MSCTAFSMEIDIVDPDPPLSAAFAPLCYTVSPRNVLVGWSNTGGRHGFVPIGTGFVPPGADIRAHQPEMLPQRGPGVLVTEQTAPLKLRDHQPNELLEGARHPGRANDEAVTGPVGEPLLELVGED